VPSTEPIAQVARGFAMGAADIVPGVSGGTVALVTGIYERLIANVHEGASSLKELVTGNPKGFVAHLKAIEWAWIIPLAVGLLTAIASLASVIEHLLEDQPQAMAGLFFGLVLGSVVVAWRLVPKVTAGELGMMFAVAAALFLLLGLRSSTSSGNEAEVVTEPLWMFFIAGAIAICAMILPGISGSFILVMLGMYPEVLGAVNDRDLLALLVFVAGCVVGLSLFSTLLNWLLERYRSMMLAAMIGLMLGSLRVLWPWPDGTDSTTLGAPVDPVLLPIGLAVVGFAVVIAVELISSKLLDDPAA
jgi:putative membrane protein